MKNLTKFTAACGILFALSVAIPAVAQKKPVAPSVPSTPANTTFNINSRSGTCPDSIKLWTNFRQYEGGGEHTVIADTLALAGPAKLTASRKNYVEFTAPLKSNYADCVGDATSEEESYYKFRFQNKNAIFRVDLSVLPGGTITEMSYQGVVSARPAVKWAIAD